MASEWCSCAQSGPLPAFAPTPCRYRRPHSAIERERFLLLCRSSARHTVRRAGRFPLAGGGAGARNAHKGENEMFSHIMIGSDDIARSKKFYDALFAAMGAQPGAEDARGRLAYSHHGGRFMVTKPIDCKTATTLNGGTIGFLMRDAKQP